ncbi:DUF2516 family protein [Streptomyces calidiresistens]|uniref:DUF2516 family protein n=1 Tax=Streptomyces calidiresistens TaxID=1485586 RepID=A0A7W3XW14_9ACTN|nr:DUF2516 family protein [Streptomyces calidiresistens]MBB0229311.1 DUF2516 family protein [Streptomyces calidiresistens]
MLLEGFFSLMGLVRLGLLVLSIFALVHAVMQREDAFRAADKKTKPFWLVILGVSVAVQLFIPGFLLLALAGTIAAVVYIVDVRPAVAAVGGGGGGRGGWSSSDGPYGPYNGGR